MKLPKFRKREVRLGTAIVLCLMTAVTTVNISYILFNRHLEEQLPGYQASNEIYGKLGQIRSPGLI